ncbi:MAG: formylglycine-generating enzyme family protein, partial [Alphaproteobacteria bacterium]
MKPAPALPVPDPETMRHVPGGTFTMGSEQFYEEERPLKRVKIDPFWMDQTPVTNAQWREFI